MASYRELAFSKTKTTECATQPDFFAPSSFFLVSDSLLSLISTSCVILMILLPLALNSMTLVMISVTVILCGL